MLAPGSRDGQTKMVKDGDVISVHSWSEAEKKWTKIGDVVGQPGEDTNGAAPDGGKVTYEGKEYDFVFDIELDSGGKLKLPYNRTDDVWMTAQNFIHKHELPQSHLDTIANFLIRNGGPVQSTNSGVVYDPLTGGSAYTSGSGGAVHSNGGGAAYDPFTGGNAYTSSGTNPAPVPMDVDNVHFPKKDFDIFNAQPKFEMMTKKLLEFNRDVQESQQLPEERLERVHKLCIAKSDWEIDDVLCLIALLKWPLDKAFPSLDILRLAVINPGVVQLLEEQNSLKDIYDILTLNLRQAASPTSQMLALRSLVNFFHSSECISFVIRQREEVYRLAVALLPTDNKNVQISLSSLMLNYAIASCDTDDEEGQKFSLTTLCMLCLEAITDPEAKYRVLVALGTLLNKSKSNVTMAKSLEANTHVQTWKMTAGNVKKVEECASFVLASL